MVVLVGSAVSGPRGLEQGTPVSSEVPLQHLESGIPAMVLGGSAVSSEIPLQWHHTMGYDPFIKSQLASHNQLEGLLWCTLGHEVVTILSESRETKPA